MRISPRLAVMALASLVLLTSSALAAKNAPEPPRAPVPAQITAAKKLFIANGGSALETFGNPNLAYDEFYQAMKHWGRFQLVSTPAEADVVYQIEFNADLAAPQMPQLFAERTKSILRFQLTILDPRTNIVLWRSTEHVEIAALQSTWRRNFDSALQALVSDVHVLVELPPAAAPAPAK